MKLKDQLILREVAGQYVIVPTGKRVTEVTSIVYISASAAYLWDYMKDREFTKEELVAKIMEHYTGVTEERASADIERFLQTWLTITSWMTVCSVEGRLSVSPRRF